MDKIYATQSDKLSQSEVLIQESGAVPRISDCDEFARISSEQFVKRVSKSEIQVRSRSEKLAARIADCDKFPKFLGAGWQWHNNQKFSEQLRGFLNSSGR